MNERELPQPQTDRLHLFISSRMQELEDLRAHLHRELEKIGIDAFVYEVALGARPEDPETVSLLQVERSDGSISPKRTQDEIDPALLRPILLCPQLSTTPSTLPAPEALSEMSLLDLS